MLPEIRYIQEGKHLLPLVETIPAEGTMGKYGMLRGQFLQEHRPERFAALVLKNQLDGHLLETDREAREKTEALAKKLLELNPAPDKKADSLAWARHMNQIRLQAEEIILGEIIYN